MIGDAGRRALGAVLCQTLFLHRSRMAEGAFRMQNYTIFCEIQLIATHYYAICDCAICAFMRTLCK